MVQKARFSPFLDLIEPIYQSILGVRTSNMDQNTSNYLKYHTNIIRYGQGALTWSYFRNTWKNGPKSPFFGPFLDLVESISQLILGVRISNMDQNTSNYLKYHKNIIRYGQGMLTWSYFRNT